MIHIIEFFLSLIYPATCGFCNKICKDYICKKCEIELKKFKIDLITKPKNKYFDECFYLFKYQGQIRHIIIDYKFQEKSYLYKTFSKIILKNKKACGFLKKYDIIVAVPIHKKRKNKRGYNQTELITRDIAKKINIEFKSNLLIKSKNTIPQSKLNKIDRIKNVQNAFLVNKKIDIKNKNIVIIDDIYTTGSTLNECSKILKHAGANKIGIFTIAKD